MHQNLRCPLGIPLPGDLLCPDLGDLSTPVEMLHIRRAQMVEQISEKMRTDEIKNTDRGGERRSKTRHRSEVKNTEVMACGA